MKNIGRNQSFRTSSDQCKEGKDTLLICFVKASYPTSATILHQYSFLVNIQTSVL